MATQPLLYHLIYSTMKKTHIILGDTDIFVETGIFPGTTVKHMVLLLKFFKEK